MRRMNWALLEALRDVEQCYILGKECGCFFMISDDH